MRPTGADNVTSTPLAVPVKLGSGTKVTSPVVGLIVYVPSPATVTDVASVSIPVAGSTNLAGYVALGVIAILSPFALVAVVLKVGVPVWLAPCTSVDVLLTPSISIGVTVGTY